METFVHHQEHPVDLAMAGGRPEAGPIRMELTKANLWREFHSEGNEMIITKSGRNLFPKLKVRLYGLQPEEHYTVVLEMRLAAPRRFKFSNNHWVDAGEADPQFDEHRTYVQSVVPDKHATWCDVDLKNAKISNSTVDGRGNIVLTSMHKYIPYLHVIRGADMQGHHLVPSSLPVTTAFFPETEFIAVTAYQNDAITRKKIENNPFAKGFRETGKAKCRRNQRQSAACVLQGAKEALEMMQEARRDSAASPMSSACSTSSACSASSDSEAFAFRGLPTPPASRTPTPPLRPCLPCAVPPTRGFGIDDILYGDRYSTRRAFHETIAPAAPLPVHPLYQFMYAPMPYWVPYPGLYAPSIPTMAPIAPLPLTMDAAEAYHSYPNMFKQE